LNGGEDVVCFAFSFVDHRYLVYQSHVDGGGEKYLVTKDVFNQVISKVQDECKGAAQDLVSKLEHDFPQHEMMISLCVIYA
jgi:hypothetical protein